MSCTYFLMNTRTRTHTLPQIIVSELSYQHTHTHTRTQTFHIHSHHGLQTFMSIHTLPHIIIIITHTRTPPTHSQNIASKLSYQHTHTHTSHTLSDHSLQTFTSIYIYTHTPPSLPQIIGTELRIAITSKKLLLGVHEIGTASISIQDLAKGNVDGCTFLDESGLLRKSLILVKPGSRKSPNDRCVCCF